MKGNASNACMRSKQLGARVSRVLHIVGRMDRAGAETMVMNLYREIDRSRFQFDFAYFTTDRCDYDEEIEALGGRIHRIGAASPAARFRALYRLLRTGEWSIVHAHTLFSSGLHLTAARVAKVQQRIAHAHSTQDANSGSILGRLYQRVSRALLKWSATHYVACGLAAGAYLFPGRKDVVLLPNAVDISKFSEASGAVRGELGIPSAQLVVLQVGRFMPVKNHERSIRIADAMRQAGVDFQLLLVGAGPEQSAIERLVADKDLGKHVRLLGLRADIPELMAAADVMLMPSHHEGFPVVLVEAQAAGLPAVVSSAVSSEVELGMGMVHFVDLDATDRDWVKALEVAARVGCPDKEVRRASLERAGFSSAAGARQLEQVYNAT
ncbi:glycosyltransferase [Lysobacter sp. A03]|uniref:glycosyltransferase n=1 Tax=Lysobacter sp. A03 TaxID=1199154 RepID=UPI0005B709FF|nr:glycosyltransferase [Lysobacter sp. A03]KIQ97492.1 capsular polysaccharide biosynthesis protein [Lysobacter sp. A03]